MGKRRKSFCEGRNDKWTTDVRAMAVTTRLSFAKTLFFFLSQKDDRFNSISVEVIRGKRVELATHFVFSVSFVCIARVISCLRCISSETWCHCRRQISLLLQIIEFDSYHWFDFSFFVLFYHLLIGSSKASTCLCLLVLISDREFIRGTLVFSHSLRNVDPLHLSTFWFVCSEG